MKFLAIIFFVGNVKNPKKLWAIGTPCEKDLIIRKIMTVLEWRIDAG